MLAYLKNTRLFKLKYNLKKKILVGCEFIQPYFWLQMHICKKVGDGHKQLFHLSLKRNFTIANLTYRMGLPHHPDLLSLKPLHLRQRARQNHDLIYKMYDALRFTIWPLLIGNFQTQI